MGEIGEEVSDRPAVRIVCVDGTGRVLLMRWHDPVAGRSYWEPPGGGVDAGESPIEAARRELFEETGLPGEAVEDGPVLVHRDFRWLGTRYVKDEPFFLARFEGVPAVKSAAFTAEEVQNYRGHAWHAPGALAALADVEPPGLLEAITPLLARCG
ncbi:NUDIX hydrolase [Spirillospora sp. NPDC050679]